MQTVSVFRSHGTKIRVHQHFLEPFIKYYATLYMYMFMYWRARYTSKCANKDTVQVIKYVDIQQTDFRLAESE